MHFVMDTLNFLGNFRYEKKKKLCSKKNDTVHMHT